MGGLSNGAESRTLSGGTLTLSGDVTGVAPAEGIQVGARNRDGNILVAVAPPAKPPAAPSAAQDVGLGVQIENDLAERGSGVESAAGSVKRNPAPGGREGATSLQDRAAEWPEGDW